MSFDLESAFAVREREDGLLEKDNFDVASAVPIDEIRAARPGEIPANWQPQTEEQKAQANVALAYGGEQNVPAGLKFDWELTSRPKQTITETTLMGGLNLIVQGVRSLLPDETAEGGVVDKLYKAIVYPEITKKPSDFIPGLKNLPKWSQVTISVIDDLASYGIAGLGLAALKSEVKQMLFVKDINRKLAAGQEAYVQERMQEFLPAGPVTEEAARAKFATEYRNGFIQQATAIEAELVSAETAIGEGSMAGVGSSRLQNYANKRTILGLVIDDLKNMNNKGQIKKFKIGDIVSYQNPQGAIEKAVIKEIDGKRIMLQMGNSQIVAMANQLSLPPTPKEAVLPTPEAQGGQIKDLPEVSLVNRPLGGMKDIVSGGKNVGEIGYRMEGSTAADIDIKIFDEPVNYRGQKLGTAAIAKVFEEGATSITGPLTGEDPEKATLFWKSIGANVYGGQVGLSKAKFLEATKPTTEGKVEDVLKEIEKQSLMSVVAKALDMNAPIMYSSELRGEPTWSKQLMRYDSFKNLIKSNGGKLPEMLLNPEDMPKIGEVGKFGKWLDMREDIGRLKKAAKESGATLEDIDKIDEEIDQVVDMFLKASAGQKPPKEPPKTAVSGGPEPEEGGLNKEEISPELLKKINLSEQEYIQKIILEGKSIKEVAKENGETVAETQKSLQWAIDDYRNIEDEYRQGMERASTADEKAAQAELKDYLTGKLNSSLQEKGEYANLKHLKWLFSPEGQTPDLLASELSEMGYNVQGDSEVLQLIKDKFGKEIAIKAESKAQAIARQERTRLKNQISNPGKTPQLPAPEREITGVGKGGIIGTSRDVDNETLSKIHSKMPFTLLGNKGNIISRMTKVLKDALTDGIKNVYDLFGGAKGYRIGLFPKVSSSQYNFNELSNERNNYYRNVQDPEKHRIMINTIADLKDGLVDAIASAFDIDISEQSPEYIKTELNKWLSEGITNKRYRYVRDIVQAYGNKLMAEASADNFVSPESSAKYFFLENTALFGVKQTPEGYRWKQHIIVTSKGISQLREAIGKLENASELISAEHSRDKEMRITQEDAWNMMDRVTAEVGSGNINPKETVVLVDPQYLNPTNEEGTYSVGLKDTTWEGHKANLEEHLLPLLKTGVKVIYTNNLDPNLMQWLQDNNIPFNIETGVGAGFGKAGRNEIISFINYDLPERLTAGDPLVFGREESGGIFGESPTYRRWLADHAAEIEEKTSPIGRFTPDERKALVEEAMKKGLIYTDFKGKQHDRLQGLLHYYRTASMDEIKGYIANLKGEPTNPARLYKLTGDINKDSALMQLISKENENWIDINKVEMEIMDPVRIIEKVSGKDVWDDNILSDNTFDVLSAADEAMFDRKVAELEALEKAREGIVSGSKESAEIMRKFETKLPLTPKEQKVVDFLRSKYDMWIEEANAMRKLLNRPPIPYRQDYMTHIREQNLLSEFFKGDERQMEKISNDQMDAIRKGDYTKGNMPFNKFAQKRMGEKTKFDAIGNYIKYMDVITKEIYYTPAITHARKFIEYALLRQPNAYKAMDRLLNDLKGKTSIVDENILGKFASSKPIKFMRSHIARSALVGNINFWAMNASNFVTAYPEIGNYLNVGMGKFIGSKKWREFAFKNSRMLKGRAIDPDFLDRPVHMKLEEVVGGITNVIEYNNVGSTFVGAYLRAKEQLGYSEEKAIKYADAIAKRTQVGYKKYELNAWMRSNAGMLLSQFQTWTFNGLNYILYDLGTASIPEDLASLFKETKTNRARWKAIATLIGIAITVNAIYKRLGLREPYSPDAALPSIAGLNYKWYQPGRYTDIGPIKIIKDIGTSFTGKREETRRKAMTRVATALVPGGTQIARFLQGNIFPNLNNTESKPRSL